MQLEKVALACWMLSLSRRSQEAAQTIQTMMLDAPEGVFTADEIAEGETSLQQAADDMRGSLDRLVALTGTPSVGAEVLARTNTVIRAELAHAAAVKALRSAALCALEDDEREITKALAHAPDEEHRARVAIRLEDVRGAIAEIRAGASKHFDQL